MAGRGDSRVPERWTDYTPLGCRMPGTRFIAFKVPLKESFDQNLLPEERFTPQDLLRKVRERQEELGLIIDLTYTRRYYGREELPPTLRYAKILTMGRQIPNRKTILTFKYLVKKFLTHNKDNDKLIGVHCTHGLNRTGYVVCRYLIDVEGMEPNAAIELFNKSRGHPIERINYIQDLQRRALKNCEGKNLGSDPIRKQGSAPGKPQKQQVVKHPPSQPPLAVPRSPGSARKKRRPEPPAQGQPQEELGHRALGQRQLGQEQVKKLEQRQQKHLEEKQQKKPEQRQLEQPGQKQQQELEQRQQKKLEKKKQKKLEKKKQKKLEKKQQNHLEQRQNHLEQRQNHLEQRQNHLEQRQQKKLKHLEQNHLEQDHLEQRQQKKLKHLEQDHLEQRQQKKLKYLEQDHLEQNDLEQKQQKKLKYLEQNHLEQRQNYLEQRQQSHLEQRQQKKLKYLEQDHLEQRQQNHLEQNHLEQRQQKKLKRLEQNDLEQRQQKKLKHLEQDHLEQNDLEQRQNHLEQRQQKKLKHLEQDHLEQRQPCSWAPGPCWFSAAPRKQQQEQQQQEQQEQQQQQQQELFSPQSPPAWLPRGPCPGRKRRRRRRNHELQGQERS